MSVVWKRRRVWIVLDLPRMCTLCNVLMHRYLLRRTRSNEDAHHGRIKFIGFVNFRSIQRFVGRL